MAEYQAKLVVVDDDEEIAALIEDLGRQAGYSVTTITDPKRIRHDPGILDADVILLDLQMPDFDGVQIMRLLADTEVAAGIVLVSGADDRTRAAAEAYGEVRGLRIFGAVEKPFSPEDLLETIRAAVAGVAPLTAADLEKALNDEELLVVYQPTVALSRKPCWQVDRVEALLRWDHPQRGLIGPDDFIPMAEASGLIGSMTDFVIRQGLEQLRGWQRQRQDLGLRVNVSPLLLADVEFPDRLESSITKSGIDPASLTLEITETAMLDRYPETIDILTRFRLKKLNLTIDSFGVGYSSLSHISHMPFNEIKIDGALLASVPDVNEANVMVEALVDLAHKLGLGACAKGVESKETLEFLEAIGCDSAQGFYVGRPIPASEISLLLEKTSERDALAASESH